MSLEENKIKVMKVLEKHPEGLTGRELSEESNLAKQTVSTIIAEFRGAKMIREREVGQAKLIYLEKQRK